MSYASLKVEISKPGSWSLSGDLTMYAVSQARKILIKNRPVSGEWLVNCEALQSVDSAGIAIFLDMMRYAKQHLVSLKIMGLPGTLKSLIEVQGLASLFEAVLYRV